MLLGDENDASVSQLQLISPFIAQSLTWTLDSNYHYKCNSWVLSTLNLEYLWLQNNPISELRAQGSQKSKAKLKDIVNNPPLCIKQTEANLSQLKLGKLNNNFRLKLGSWIMVVSKANLEYKEITITQISDSYSWKQD